MFDLLYQYLIRNKQVSLPGIGTFLTEITPARFDVANKVVCPHEYSFRLDRSSDFSGKRFFVWLAAQINETEWDAIKKLADFAYEVKKTVLAGTPVLWKGVGILSSDHSDAIKFETAKKNFVFEQQVVAEKVLRVNPVHTMTVGDKQKTSSQMVEMLSRPLAAASSIAPAWWAIAIVLAFASIMLLGWHFSEYGLSVSSTGSTKKIQPVDPPPAYKLIQ